MEEKERTIKLQERTKKTNEKAVKKSLLKILKKTFVRKGIGKEEDKELPGKTKPESRPTNEAKGTPNPDVKSQNIEKINKPSAISQEWTPLSSENETEIKKTLHNL